MDFKKKLKLRLYLGIGYILSGLIIIAVSYIIDAKNSYFSSFGLALAVVGIVRIRSYLIITKNEERIKKQQIAETDERNIAIRSKAISISFYIYILSPV